MKPEPVQERARRKRLALIDAACEEFAEKGHEQTTAKSITGRLGVSTGSFYQYFNNKDEVLQVIMLERFKTVAEQMPVPTHLEEAQRQHSLKVRAVFHEVLEFIYEFHARDAALHEVLEQRRLVDTALNRLMAEREAALVARTEAFVRLFPVAEPAIVAFCLFSMAEGIVHRHVFFPSGMSRDQVISAGTDMLAAYFENLQDE